MASIELHLTVEYWVAVRIFKPKIISRLADSKVLLHGDEKSGNNDIGFRAVRKDSGGRAPEHVNCCGPCHCEEHVLYKLHSTSTGGKACMKLVLLLHPDEESESILPTCVPNQPQPTSVVQEVLEHSRRPSLVYTPAII